MTIDEEIQKQEEKSMTYKSMGNQLSKNMSTEQQIRAMEDYHMSDYHRQLADWLKELKESRMVLDILGQFLADMGTDICCEDLIMEDDYCEKYCENQKPLCWYRWAKMKAKEINADES